MGGKQKTTSSTDPENKEALVPPRKPPTGDVVDDLVDAVIYQHLDLPTTGKFDLIKPPPLGPADELRLLDKFLLPNSWLAWTPHLFREPTARVLIRLISTPEARHEHLLRLSREGNRFEGDTDIEEVYPFVVYGPFSPRTGEGILMWLMRDPAALMAAIAMIRAVTQQKAEAEFDWRSELAKPRAPFRKGDDDDLVADKIYEVVSRVYPPNRSLQLPCTGEDDCGGDMN